MAEEVEGDNVPYGVVRFVRGSFEGSLGYYDDDDEDDTVIVYLGTPHASKCVVVPIDYIRTATPEEQIEFEISYTSELDPELRKRMGI